MVDWSNRSLYYTDFAKQGEEAVKRDYASGILDGEVRAYAGDWLRKFDEEREAQRRLEIDQAALDAARASVVQAEAAQEANRIARQALKRSNVSNAIAILAAVAAVIGLFMH